MADEVRGLLALRSTGAWCGGKSAANSVRAVREAVSLSCNEGGRVGKQEREEKPTSLPASQS